MLRKHDDVGFDDTLSHDARGAWLDPRAAHEGSEDEKGDRLPHAPLHFFPSARSEGLNEALLKVSS
ncbi:MAG: hypothetical protein ACREJX_13920, partial [Polyangiaceae bacterium]